jgi:AcrR family transcriptional regulator
MFMPNQDDPRVKRTRQLIQKAFWEQMLSKGFDAVTVQDIAQEATINRATFYAHYPDKYAVLDDIAAAAFEQRIPEHIKTAHEFTKEVCQELVSLTYDYIISFYQLCRYDNKSFSAQIDGKIKQILLLHIKSILTKEKKNVDTNINAAMISSAIYSAAYYWYCDKKGDNLAALSNVVVSFIMGGLTGGV